MVRLPEGVGNKAEKTGAPRHWQLDRFKPCPGRWPPLAARRTHRVRLSLKTARGPGGATPGPLFGPFTLQGEHDP